jgi:hypothetical protein
MIKGFEGGINAFKLSPQYSFCASEAFLEYFSDKFYGEHCSVAFKSLIYLKNSRKGDEVNGHKIHFILKILPCIVWSGGRVFMPLIVIHAKLAAFQCDDERSALRPLRQERFVDLVADAYCASSHHHQYLHIQLGQQLCQFSHRHTYRFR